jgi:mono/diheme cytochrome c family protein
MGISSDDARFAVGLFNAYCARCHTGGYSAGPSFEQGAGSGAWAPALFDGRTLIQFPDAADQKSFIITGSQNAAGYGVNGIGSGRMPGFGNVLSSEQIDLIVQYERSM